MKHASQAIFRHRTTSYLECSAPAPGEFDRCTANRFRILVRSATPLKEILVRAKESAEFQQIMEELQSSGLLLESDAALPSVASLVAQEPIRGSWWGHPRGHDIFQANRQLAAHPDVIACKLISGKVTYVHRSLWPALFEVANSRETWQLSSISPSARSLLSKVTRDGIVRTDRLPEFHSAKSKGPGDAARELEKMLLVYSEDIHTETGAHAKALETWEHWARRIGFVRQKTTVEQGKEQLEQTLKFLNTRFGAARRLPWATTRSKIQDR